MIPFFVSVPHAGEKVPDETPWLIGLPETLLMCDVDRYVDRLYRPATEAMGVPIVVADYHRYVVDLNRVPTDIDSDSVEESENPPGTFTTGFHWSKTTTGAELMREPMSQKLHRQLTEKYFTPFHKLVSDQLARFKAAGCSAVFHLDAHSMPSQGTSAHRDPGTKRPEIVVSDRDGTSCSGAFKDLVMKAYSSVGFQVAYNWPYKGGRITETYGRPNEGQHTLQVEMNRALYMDEITKKPIEEKFEDVKKRLVRVFGYIVGELKV